jgi:hypothetical protein
MVEELLREDGLSIMAAGLAWQRVAGVLVQIQMERRRSAPPCSAGRSMPTCSLTLYTASLPPVLQIVRQYWASAPS